MSTRTLMFEDIAPGNTVTNTYPTDHWNLNPQNIALYWPLFPWNSSGFGNLYPQLYSLKIQVGRQGQTKGDIAIGDKYPDLPICPYHTKRSNRRYEDGRLHIRKKAPGEIIKADDINNLIYKLQLFKYLWEAEANNIYGYANASASSSNPKLDLSNLRKIKASDAESISDIPNIIDPRIDGAKQVRINKEPQFYSFTGANPSEIRNQLQTKADEKMRTNVTFNNISTHGFPKELDEVYLANENDTPDPLYPILHGGFETLEGIKFIQSNNLNGLKYRLMYISGIKGGTLVKDSKGKIMEFNFGTPYIFSTRADNSPRTLETYYGFIGYYLPVPVDPNGYIEYKTETNYLPPEKRITKKYHYDEVVAQAVYNYESTKNSSGE